MVRVGQTILTTDMEVAFVLQVRDEGYFCHFADGNRFDLVLDSEVWNIIDGPTETETEDLAHTTLKIEAESTTYIAYKSFSFSKGDIVTWVVQVGQADLDVKGVVLSSNTHFTTASEWGCGVAERVWVIPTFMLKKSTRY
jgi:hypothetical protein